MLLNIGGRPSRLGVVSISVSNLYCTCLLVTLSLCLQKVSLDLDYAGCDFEDADLEWDVFESGELIVVA